MKTWREEISVEMTLYGDDWANVEHAEITDAELDTPFDDSYGCAEGIPFTIWTKSRVYLPHAYDGADFVISVSRHPNGKRVNNHSPWADEHPEACE